MGLSHVTLFTLQSSLCYVGHHSFSSECRCTERTTDKTSPECVFCLGKDVKRMWRSCGESGTQLWFKAHTMCESTISGFIWSAQHPQQNIHIHKIFNYFIIYFHFQNQVSFHDEMAANNGESTPGGFDKESFSQSRYRLDISGLLLPNIVSYL